MTKYIVQSGGLDKDLELKRQFHREIVNGLGDSPKFLLCNFGQPREDWETRLPGYVGSILEDMPEGVTPTFTLAMPSDFEKQCREADVVYLHGGDDHLYKYWMSRFDLPSLFKDKVVATNSASSNMVSTHWWTCDWRECGDGFGILPIKFISHYMSNFGADDPRGPIDWEKAKQELADYGDKSLPIYALREGEYKVFGV